MMGDRHIDYEALAQRAMRGMVRDILSRVAKTGLPGEHHFYIAFGTDAPGVVISKRLKEKYPDEMTVVLQHRFWDLTVSEDRFEVKLTFDGIAERVCVPFAAIKVFFDPSVPYGLQFEEAGLGRSNAAESGREAAPRPGSVSKPAQIAPPGKGRATTFAPAPRIEKKARPMRRRAEKGEAEPRTADAAGAHALPKSAEGEAAAGSAQASGDAKVVSLDKFRRK
jgi:hypothetical protein